MFRNATLFLLTLSLGGAVALGGWWTLFLRDRFGDHQAELLEKTAEIETLNQSVLAKNEEIDVLDREVARLETSIRLLKVDHRVAELEVLSQEPNPDAPDETISTVRFTEFGSDGEPVGEARVIEIKGKKIYVETLVVKFDDALVEAGDPLRGTSICLFQRMFGENQEPSDGTPLDPVGAQPFVYGGDTLPDPEVQGLWQDFWKLANDPELAQSRGVRAAHGEAPFIEGRPGKRYRLELRSSGGMTILTEP